MGIHFRCHHCEYELHVKDFQASKRGRCPKCKGKFRIPLADAEYSLAVDSGRSTDSDSQIADRLVAQEPEQAQKIKEQLTKDGKSSRKSEQPTEPATAGWEALSEKRGAPPHELREPPRPKSLADAAAKWFVRPMSGGQYGPASVDEMWCWIREDRVGRDALVWCEGWSDWLVASQVFADYFAETIALAETNADATTTVSVPTVPQIAQPTLSERNRAARKLRRRRNYKIMIAVLSVVMLLLMVALFVVLTLD